jgi:hypothetical protein
MTLVDTLSHAKHAMLQIDVPPAQSQQFSDPKSGEDEQPSQRTGWLRQSLQ